MAENKWKDFLLKSGLPLEYEVKELLDKRKCISSFEYSYLRSDENKIVNEFSFDIDSAYIKENHFFKLMIECKYRDNSTNWLFLPGDVYHPNKFGEPTFLHPCDYFTENLDFPRKNLKLQKIGKSCLKGIEINSSGQNPKSITQAVNQLSYAMAEMISDSMLHQYERLLSTSDFIFYNVPIIVTTANLYRLKEDVTIEKIKLSNEILELATKENYIILETKIGKDLANHNRKIFSEFITKHGKTELESRLNSFHKDVNFVFEVISSKFSPKSVLIIQHTNDSDTFDKLFKLMDKIVRKVK